MLLLVLGLWISGINWVEMYNCWQWFKNKRVK